MSPPSDQFVIQSRAAVGVKVTTALYYCSSSAAVLLQKRLQRTWVYPSLAVSGERRLRLDSRARSPLSPSPSGRAFRCHECECHRQSWQSPSGAMPLPVVLDSAKRRGRLIPDHEQNRLLDALDFLQFEGPSFQRRHLSCEKHVGHGQCVGISTWDGDVDDLFRVRAADGLDKGPRACSLSPRWYISMTGVICCIIA